MGIKNNKQELIWNYIELYGINIELIWNYRKSLIQISIELENFLEHQAKRQNDEMVSTLWLCNDLLQIYLFRFPTQTIVAKLLGGTNLILGKS